MEAIENTAIAAERGILSSIFSAKPEGLFWQNSVNIHFFHEIKHRIIFSAINQVLMDGFQPDKLLVQALLTRSALLESAGGEEYLKSLNSPVSSVSQFESYVEIIKNHSMKQALTELGERFITYGKTESGDAAKDWEKARIELNKTESFFYQGGIPSIDKSVDEFLRELEIHVAQEKTTDGVPTGLQALDEMIGGFGKGELVIVGARPAMGKTGFMLSCISNLLQRNIPVAWFTLELSTNMLINRLTSMEAEIESHKIRRGTLSGDEFSRVVRVSEKLKNAPLHVMDEAGIRSDKLALLSRKLHEMHGVRLIVVDYLQLMSHDKKSRYDSRELQISEICRTLKRLARDLNIPVVVLSQLSRAVETRGGDKKPILSDLRESGAIEQDADKVLFLYRGEYYGLEMDAEGNSTKNIAEIIVAKNRFGPLGEARVKFVPRFAKFENPEGYVKEFSADEIPIADERLREKFKRVFLQSDENDFETPF